MLFWVDRQGHEQPVSSRPQFYQDARLSPDDSKIALTLGDDERDLWVWDIARETMTRLTFGPAVERAPVWTDAQHVSFLSTSETAVADIFRKAADSTGTLESLTRNGTGGLPQSLAPDGQLIFEKRSGPESDLMLLPAGSGDPKPLLANPNYIEAAGSVSPDGQWLAYQSNETGILDVYVRPFPAVEAGRWKISDGGGVRPVWSRTGRELFFVSTFGGDLSRAQMMSVAVAPGPSFSSGKPQALFPVTPQVVGIPPYAVARDGRFLMIKTADPTENTRHRFVVVSNWVEEVKARLKK